MNIIFKIMIIICILLIIISYISKPYKNPYQCIGYIGKKGSGKTTKLTQIAIQNIKKGKIVYSTEIIPGTRNINYKDIGDYDFEENSILLIDEIGLLFPARNYMNFRQEVREFFKLQRHKKVKIYWFTQTWIDCDKTIRDLTDKLYLCHNFFNMFSSYRQVSKVLTIGTGKNEDGSSNNQGSDFIECFKFVPIFTAGAIEITFIPRYTFFFDSYKHDEKTKIRYINIDMLEDTKKYMSNLYTYKILCKQLLLRLINDIKTLLHIKKNKKGG